MTRQRTNASKGRKEDPFSSEKQSLLRLTESLLEREGRTIQDFFSYHDASECNNLLLDLLNEWIQCARQNDDLEPEQVLHDAGKFIFNLKEVTSFITRMQELRFRKKEVALQMRHLADKEEFHTH